MKQKDLTIVYYTANQVPKKFLEFTQRKLLEAIGDTPLISVSQKPMDFGENICVGNIGVSTLNIYRQAMEGARRAKTRYIALAEDDALYTPSHFDFRPSEGVFAYNRNIWGLYTWTEPLFSYKGRRSLWALICERDLFIKVMEERFSRYPKDEDVPLNLWGEPGKYEHQMGVTENKTVMYKSKEPSVVFSHPTALGFLTLGKRKKLGENRTPELEPWGKAENLQAIYNKAYGIKN